MKETESFIQMNGMTEMERGTDIIGRQINKCTDESTDVYEYMNKLKMNKQTNKRDENKHPISRN